MTESSPEASNQNSQNDAIKRGVPPKAVAPSPSPVGVSRAKKRPVVVRKSIIPGQPPHRVNQKICRKSATVVANQSQLKVPGKTIKRHGQPDFSSSIITEGSAHKNRKRLAPSMEQRLFFDAAIAVVTLSFMVLTFLHL